MSRRIAALALMLLAAPVGAQSPAPAPAAPPLQVPYRQFQLTNGLNVILHQDRTVPVVAVNAWYHVGSANEKQGRTGFAHLFEHLMFEGSKNVPEGQFEDRKSTRLNSSHLVNSYAAFCLKKKHNR